MRNRLQKQFVFILAILACLSIFAASCGDDTQDMFAPAEPIGTEAAVELPPFTPEQTPQDDPLPPSPPPPPTPPSPSPKEVPSPEPEPEIEPIESLPVWMTIPSLGVDAEIQGTETDHAVNSMAIMPSGTIISWWIESAIPGNQGNAIFGGHNRWGGELGQLFALDTLEIGAEMDITYEDETTLKYRLESVFVYALATAPASTIMDVGGETRLTLITCKDPFNPQTGTSDNRIIAVFKPDEGFVIPDPPITPLPPRER